MAADGLSTAMTENPTFLFGFCEFETGRLFI